MEQLVLNYYYKPESLKKTLYSPDCFAKISASYLFTLSNVRLLDLNTLLGLTFFNTHNKLSDCHKVIEEGSN